MHELQQQISASRIVAITLFFLLLRCMILKWVNSISLLLVYNNCSVQSGNGSFFAYQIGMSTKTYMLNL